MKLRRGSRPSSGRTNSCSVGDVWVLDGALAAGAAALCPAHPVKITPARNSQLSQRTSFSPPRKQRSRFRAMVGPAQKAVNHSAIICYHPLAACSAAGGVDSHERAQDLSELDPGGWISRLWRRRRAIEQAARTGSELAAGE